MKSRSIRKFTAEGIRTCLLALFGGAAAVLGACNRSSDLDEPQAGGKGGGGAAGGGETVQAIAKERNLSPDDITAALKTYTPSGRRDDYVMFASGGHAGQ